MSDEQPSVAEIADEVDLGDAWDTETDDLGTYRVQEHNNGETTVLQLSSYGDALQIIAFDVAADGELLETEQVGTAPTTEEAIATAEGWLANNPKGILGGGPEGAVETVAAIGRLLRGDPA
jgi:hypothetical protein